MNTEKDPFRFYVYAYLRSKDSTTAKAGTPYYIGKGQGNRAYQQNRKNIPKNPSNIVILESSLTEIGAFALERRYIGWYGRKDISTGILSNLTDGGEGSSGILISEETKQKLIRARTGSKRSEITKEKMRIAQTGKKATEETKKRLRESHLGIKPSKESVEKMAMSKTGVLKSEETKRRMSECKTGEKHYLFGKTHSYETKQRMSIAQSGVNNHAYGTTKPILTCPHCGKDGGGSVMYRHHFDKCRSLSQTGETIALEHFI